jgi:hypothetical protein
MTDRPLHPKLRIRDLAALESLNDRLRKEYDVAYGRPAGPQIEVMNFEDPGMYTILYKEGAESENAAHRECNRINNLQRLNNEQAFESHPHRQPKLLI